MPPRLQILRRTRLRRLRRELFTEIRAIPDYPGDVARLRDHYWTPLLMHPNGAEFLTHPLGYLRLLAASPPRELTDYLAPLTNYVAALEDFVSTDLRIRKKAQPPDWALAAVHEDVRGYRHPSVDPWGPPDPTLTMRMTLEVTITLDGATIRSRLPDVQEDGEFVHEEHIPSPVRGYAVFDDLHALEKTGIRMWKGNDQTPGIISFLDEYLQDMYAGELDRADGHNEDPERTLYRDRLRELARWCYLREKPDVKTQKVLRLVCRDALQIDPPSDRKKRP